MFNTSRNLDNLVAVSSPLKANKFSSRHGPTCTNKNFFSPLTKMSKFGRRIKQPPPGYEYIEPTLTALDNELRESESINLLMEKLLSHICMNAQK